MSNTTPGGRTSTPVAELLAAMSAQQPGRTEALQYSSTRDDRRCGLYRSLGHNKKSFKRWYATDFHPRVWEPIELEAMEARDKKLATLQL